MQRKVGLTKAQAERELRRMRESDRGRSSKKGGRVTMEDADAEARTITFHELRHTFGTRMAAAGTPLRTLQQWMGHADSKTTQVYAHYQPSEAAVEAVDRAFA